MSGEMNVDLDALARPWSLAPLEERAGERTLAFESWARLTALLTGERYRILHHLRGHPENSVNALADALDRDFRRVHEDVTVLEMAGLLDSSEGTIRVTADRLSVVLVL
jgi:predicted transcriptional regulator